MLVKLIRFMSILLLISGLFWWGEEYGPRSAVADVYRTQKIDLDKPLARFKSDKHPLAERSIILNGIQSNVTLSFSDQSISNLMKELELFSRRNLDLAASTNELDRQLIRTLTRPYQVIGKNSAMFVHLIQQIQPGMGAEVLKRLANKEPFGHYANLGFSIVLNRAENGRTAIWKTEFKSDKDFFKFLENDVKESSGNDILGIQGFPGSQRIMSFAESTQIGQGYVTVYEGKGSINDHVQHYKTILHQLGLTERKVIHSAKGKMLYFYKPNYEVTVFMSESENKQHEIMDVIELSVKS